MSRPRWPGWVLLCWLCLSPLCAAAGPALDVSRPIEGSLNISEYVEVLEDPAQALSLAELQADGSGFRLAGTRNEALNFGFTRSAIWLRFALHNPSPQPVELLLELGGRTSYADFHHPVDGGGYHTVKTGMARPFSTRAYPNRMPVFPVSLPARSTRVFYLRLQSTNSVIVPLRLWTPRSFERFARNDYFIQALYFGIALAMALFNLLLYLALRDRLYLIYVGVVSSMGLTLAAQTGLAHEYLWPGSGPWSNISTFVGYPLVLASTLAFSRSMLKTQEMLPRFDRILKGAFFFLLLFPLVYLGPAQLTMPLSLPVYGGALLLVVGVPLYGVWRRQRTALLFLLAFALTAVGGVLILLRAIGVVPTNELTLNSMQFGSALESILLAIALADRFKTIQQEKAQAQREAAEAQQRLVHSLQASERDLEERVVQRTAELQNSKRRLQTTLDDLVRTQAELVESERKASTGERVANAALIAAEEANRARSDFLARIGHDLRAPLTAITGYAEMIASSGREQARNGHIIRRSARHLLALIDDLIDYARGNSQTARLQPTPLYAFTLLDGIAADAAALARRNGNRFQYRIDGSLPPVIEVDGKRLRQILDNLLGNAAKFTRNGEIVFSVRAAASDPGDSLFVFEVSDTGPGMAADQLSRIFEPFQRLKAAEGHEGLGLGLAIARQWADRLGGRIDATSAPGAGTTMRVSLPVKRAREEAVPEAHLKLDEFMLPALDGQGLRLWVVEDNPVIRNMLCTDLSGLGFAVWPAASGLQVLARIEDDAGSPPDLILTDLQMPGADGELVLQQARARWPALPVVLLSACPELAHADFTAALSKPVSLAELRQTLANALGLTLREQHPAEDGSGDEAQSPTMCRPDAERLDEALRLIRLGAMSDLVVWAETLASFESDWQAFARRARQLAELGDLRGLQALCAPASAPPPCSLRPGDTPYSVS